MAAIIMNSSSGGTNRVTITSTIEQICKKQDFTKQGEGVDFDTGEAFKWAILNDGHGSDDCIRFIRSIPNAKLSELIGSKLPVHELALYIDESGCVSQCVSSGATVVIVKVYKNRAVCINSGDSKVTAFKDGVMIYQSTEHNCHNIQEAERVNNLGFTFITTNNIRILAPNLIEPCSSLYMLFPNDDSATGRRLACTQALGHNSITGYAPEVNTIPFEVGCNYRFVLGSDGFYDMILDADMVDLSTKSSKELCATAANRWKQNWDVRTPDVSEIMKIQFEWWGWDDVSVVVIEAEAI